MSRSINAYLIGFIMDNRSNKIDFDTIVIGKEEFIPLHKGKKVIFFRKKMSISIALSSSDNGRSITQTMPRKTYLICDLVTSLRMVKKSSIDGGAILINSLNVIDDLIKFKKIRVPKMHEKVLYSFLNRLTFYRTYGKFLNTEGISRDDLCEAITWMKEQVMTNCIIL